LPVDDGYVVRCGGDPVCAILRDHAERARQKSSAGVLPSPAPVTFLQSYPNPCRDQTVVRYALAGDATVSLTLWTVLGQRIAVLVDGDQGAGERRELVDGRGLASGVYVTLLRVSYKSGGGFATAGRITVLR